MNKYQEALDTIKNKKAIIDGEKMTIGTAYFKTIPILQELINKYAKYKRAFKILKPIINIDNNIEEGGKEYWLSDIWGLRKLTKEEYELLEELMKGEETQN